MKGVVDSRTDRGPDSEIVWLAAADPIAGAVEGFPARSICQVWASGGVAARVGSARAGGGDADWP